MDTVIKAVKFGDLSLGQVFIYKSVRCIKVEGARGLYNAVRFHDACNARKLRDDVVVDIEIELTPDDEDNEVTLRNTAGYNEGF